MKSTVTESKVTFADLKEMLRSKTTKLPKHIKVDDVVYKVDGRPSLTITCAVPEATKPSFEIIPYYDLSGKGMVKIVQRIGENTYTESVSIKTAVTDLSWSETFGGEIETYRKVLEIFMGARYKVDWHDRPTFKDVREHLERAHTDEDEIYRLTNLPGNIAIIVTKLTTGSISTSICSYPDNEYHGRYIMIVNFSKDREHVTLKAVKSSGKNDTSVEPLTMSIDTPIDIDFEHGFDWAERFKKNGELVRQILFSMVSLDRNSDEKTY